jgi:hypothetical protein
VNEAQQLNNVDACMALCCPALCVLLPVLVLLSDVLDCYNQKHLQTHMPQAHVFSSAMHANL